MKTTMMDQPLSINHFLDRAGTLFKHNEIVSRLPDKSLVRHSYGQWHRRTLSLASALQRAGLQAGDRVATLCWNHHMHLEAYFGIPAAGGVMHTLNLRLSAEELGWIASDAKDRILIVDDVLLPLYQQMAPLHAFERVIVFPFSGAPVPAEFTSYEAFIAEGDADGFSPAPHAEDDAIAICYTSGTTGRPKGVAYSHRSTVLHTLVGCLGDHWGLRGIDVVMPVTPMFHANSWGMPYGAVMVGAKLVFPGPHLHADDLLDLMQLEPPTLSLGVPTIWMGLLQHLRTSGEKLTSVKRIMTGGSATPPLLIEAFRDEQNVRVEHGWGMTELSPVGTDNAPKEAQAGLEGAAAVKHMLKQGRILPGIDMKIVDGEGKELPWDGVAFGDLMVKGPWITSAYYGDEPGSALDADGWFATGDVSTIDPDGFMEITDRSKDVIKSGGEWISSIALENIAVSHPDVAEAAVIASRHPKWDERPLLLVVAKPGRTIDPASVLKVYEGQIAKWWLPDEVLVVDELPHTATGKLQKTTLRTKYKDHYMGTAG